MTVHVTFTLTEDQRKAFRQRQGLKGSATRADIKQFALDTLNQHLGLAATPVPLGADEVAESVQNTWARSAARALRERLDPAAPPQDCTSMDHVYPDGPKTPATKCSCGHRSWGG